MNTPSLNQNSAPNFEEFYPKTDQSLDNSESSSGNYQEGDVYYQEWTSAKHPAKHPTAFGIQGMDLLALKKSSKKDSLPLQQIKELIAMPADIRRAACANYLSGRQMEMLDAYELVLRSQLPADHKERALKAIEAMIVSAVESDQNNQQAEIADDNPSTPGPTKLSLLIPGFAAQTESSQQRFSEKPPADEVRYIEDPKTNTQQL